MPKHPQHPCAQQRCGALVDRGEKYCAAHARRKDAERPTAYERGYDRRWQDARELYLRQHPLCVMCLAEGRTTAARVVDHVVPHRGNQRLFWDETNWQSLCDYTSAFNCHGKKTAQESGM